MRLITSLLFVVLLAACNSNADKTAEGTTAPTDQKTAAPSESASKPESASSEASATPASDAGSKTEKLSYVLGVNIGNNLKKESMEISAKAMMDGLNDAMSGKVTMTEDEQRAVMQEFETESLEKRRLKAEADAAAATQFLEQNKSKEGIQTTASGLQYRIITKGDGKVKPKAESTVSVNYVGHLIDGTEFDNSIKRGKPSEFPVNQVIPGWTEGMQLMAVGDKFEFFVGPNLAYGPRGQGLIPPNALLIFEVELLEVK